MTRVMPSLHSFLETMPFLSIPYRKVLLQMARVGVYPSPGTRIYERCMDIWEQHVDIYQDGILCHSTSLKNFVMRSIADHHPLTPVFSGFLSAIIRSAPYVEMDSAKEELHKGVIKELQAAMEFQVFDGDYEPLFGETSKRSNPVFSWLPGNAAIAADLHLRFQRSKALISKYPIYPRLSKKTVGEETREQIRQYARTGFDTTFTEEYANTTIQLERIYHRRGMELGGSVEVRSAWKYGDLKPRIYYAQGGDVFPKSKFIQPVYNLILDQFPFVHRINRHNPPEEELETNELLMIYDFGCFTSRLDEIKKFARSTADFYVGTEITLVDTWLGPKTYDLGQLLHEWNEECNIYADCDITQVLEVEGDTLKFRHTTGMLGVPGNISSCTLLHGIFTAYLVGSTRKSRCVGDDAKLYINEDAANVFSHLQRFGEVARDKMEVWQRGSYDDSETWQYVKRTISRMPLNRVVTGPMMTFPTLDTLCNLDNDGYHRFLPDQETPLKRTLRLIRQWNRLLVQLWLLPRGIGDKDRELLWTFQKTVIIAIQKYKVPWKDQRDEILFRLQKEEFGENPRKIWIEMLPYDEEVLLPEFNPIVPEYYGYEGEEFQGFKTQLLSLLEKLGYVRSTMRIAKYSRKSVPESFLYMLINKQFKSCYDFQVIESIPKWSYVLYP
jgi:hypothetical protein